MTEDNSGIAFERIIEKLREVGLTWVAIQVQDEIRGGKPYIKEVRPVVDNRRRSGGTFLPLDVNEQRGKKQKLAATEEFSPGERLEILLGAVEAATVVTSALSTSVLQFFSKGGEIEPSICFLPEEFDEAKAFSLTGDQQKDSARANLANTISEARREIKSNGNV